MATMRSQLTDGEPGVRKLILSVVIPARNEENNIARCIGSLRRWLPRDICFEIIVCNHGSTDSTGLIAAEVGACVIDHIGGTVGNLRNIGARSAKGRLLLFLDSDIELTSTWSEKISSVIADLERNPKQVVGSICEVPPSDSLFINAWFAKLDRTGAQYLGTAHMLVPRALFDSLGGFDASLVSGEDVDFCRRATAIGACITIAQELRVLHHDYPTSASSFINREIWHGAGDFASFARFRKSKVAVVSSVFLGLVLLTLLAAISQKYVPAALLGSVASTLIIVCSFAKFPRQMGVLRLANIWIFVLYCLARGISGLRLLLPRFAP